VTVIIHNLLTILTVLAKMTELNKLTNIKTKLKKKEQIKITAQILQPNPYLSQIKSMANM